MCNTKLAVPVGCDRTKKDVLQEKSKFQNENKKNFLDSWVSSYGEGKKGREIKQKLTSLKNAKSSKTIVNGKEVIIVALYSNDDNIKDNENKYMETGAIVKFNDNENLGLIHDHAIALAIFVFSKGGSEYTLSITNNVFGKKKTNKTKTKRKKKVM